MAEEVVEINQDVVDDLKEGLGDFLNADEPTHKQDVPPEEEKNEDESVEKEEKTEEPSEESQDDEFSLDGIEIDDNAVPEESEKEEEEAEIEGDEKTKQTFINMRQENKSLKAKIAELENKTVDVEEVTTLKTQLKEAHDVIGRISLENHPGFKEKYDRPINLLVNQAKTMLKEMELPEDIADRAARMSVSERLRFLDTEAPDLAAALAPLYTQLDIHRNMRSEELQNHQASLEQIQGQEMQAQQQKITQVKAQHFTSALTTLQTEGNFVFMKTDNAKHNANVDKIISTAKAIFNTDDPSVQSKYLLQGISVPIYQQLLKRERAYSQSLAAELEKHGKARPRISSRSTEKTEKKADRNKPMSGDDVAKMVTPKGLL